MRSTRAAEAVAELGSFGQETESIVMTSEKLPDPRTKLVIEVITGMGLLVAVHVGAIAICAPWNGFLTQGYIAFVSIVLPIATICSTGWLCRHRGWSLGPSILLSIGSTVLSGLHFMFWAAAYAAD